MRVRRCGCCCEGAAVRVLRCEWALRWVHTIVGGAGAEVGVLRCGRCGAGAEVWVGAAVRVLRCGCGGAGAEVWALRCGC